MKEENAELQPQINRNLPVVVEWPEEHYVVPVEEIREPKNRASGLPGREVILHQVEMATIRMMRGGQTMLWWTVKIGGPLAVVAGGAFLLFQGAIWIGAIATQIWTAIIATVRTAAVGFLSVTLVAVLVVSAISYMRSGLRSRVRFQDKWTPKSGKSSTTVHIRNDIKVDTQTGKVDISNHIKTESR